MKKEIFWQNYNFMINLIKTGLQFHNIKKIPEDAGHFAILK